MKTEKKIITPKFLYDFIIILRFDKTKVAENKLFGTKKIWAVRVNNRVISKLFETKNNSKYLLGYLDEVVRPLGLV